MYNKRRRILFSSVCTAIVITLITWQNTACVHKNEDVKFSANDAFLE